MNEQELRDGLREMMAVSSQPPTMNPTAALDTAKRAHKRRRATWAGAGAGAAVVALTAGTVFALTPSGASLPIDAAAASTGLGPDGTKTSFPDGQTDRTAGKGAHADRANALLATLKAAVPATLIVSDNLTYPDGEGRKVTSAQAQFANNYGPGNAQQAWEYMATVAVTPKSMQHGGHGRVIVEVHTPGGEGYTNPDVCALAPTFWGVSGTCSTRDIQGKTVGVISKTQDPRIDNVAAYRYQDGTVVFVAQSKAPNNDASGKGGLNEGPMSVDQLAQTTLNPAFKVQ